MRKSLFERLLDFYKISYEEYQILTKEVSFNDVPSYLNFPHINEAVSLVFDCINNNKKIMVYGDYDADGIMGTSIAVKTFKYLNYNIGYYIPSRYLDGYGINLEKAKQIAEKGYELVITVDNGICANEPIKYLKDKGIKVIVLDHHQRGEELPEADYIFHPTVSNFGEIASSGAFVSYIFSTALLKRHDKYLSTMAAISLISDMMPLIGYNRNFLRTVFKDFKKGEFLPIDLLLEDDDFNETSIGMRIAPKINAVGRIIQDTSINRLVRYFTSDDPDEVLSYHSWIENQNENRKISTKIAKEKLDKVLKDTKISKSLVVNVDIEEGLVGLLANTLLNDYHLPCVVFTSSLENPNILKGSARAMHGFDLVNSFAYLSDVTLTAGGHALAGGVSINKEDFEIFKDKFDEYCTMHPLQEYVEPYINIYLNEISNENYNLVNSFGPFGESWKAPLLKLSHIKTSELMYSRSKEHIITNIGQQTRLVGFHVDKDLMGKSLFVDMFGTLRTSTFNRLTTIEFLIKKIKQSNN